MLLEACNEEICEETAEETAAGGVLTTCPADETDEMTTGAEMLVETALVTLT